MCVWVCKISLSRDINDIHQCVISVLWAFVILLCKTGITLWMMLWLCDALLEPLQNNNLDLGSVLSIFLTQRNESSKLMQGQQKELLLSADGYLHMDLLSSVLHWDLCEKSHCPMVQLWTEEHFVSGPSRGHRATVVLTPLLFTSHEKIASQPMLMLRSRYRISSGRQKGSFREIEKCFVC